MKVAITGSIRHECPFKQELDEGVVTVEYDASDGLIEIHELAALLRLYDGQQMTHESLTEDLQASISARFQVAGVTVTTRWTTAGLGVEVTAP